MSSIAKRSRMVRTTAIAVVAMATTLGLATAAIAVPPPPPNPSDSAITAGKAEVHKKASEVGSITTKLAHAKSQLQGLQDDLETKQELANKALVDQGNAQQAATKAKRNAQGAQQQAAAASAAIERAQHSLDRFASLSYEQGSTVGSVTAFVGSNSPKDVLQRSELLNAVGAAKLTALQGLQRARTAKANLDSAARSALEQANRKAAEAQQAKQAADQAKQAAVHASQAQQAQAKTIQTQMAGLQSQLGTARAKVGGLLDARAQYNQWLARKKAAEQAAARAAAARAAAARAAAARQPSNGGGQPSNGGGQQAHAPSVSHATGGGVQAVIDRAMSVLGVTYAWGGGNAYGPTRGIHDGGVADYYGDYNKIGFDCSGLMMYAFGAAGISLPHYSGYQYTAGRHVPISQIQPGDMVFYASSAGIHHVALYIGNGRMIEAPQSGEVVHVTSMRYGDGLMPYATRML